MKKSFVLEGFRKIGGFQKYIFSGVSENSLLPSFNRTQKGVLMFIAFEGPVPMSEVSRRLCLTKGAFTTVADSLEQMGYIRRIRCNNDRRIIYLETTPEGKKIASDINKDTNNRIDFLLGKLSEKERDDFLSSLERICNLIDVMRKD